MFMNEMIFIKLPYGGFACSIGYGNYGIISGVGRNKWDAFKDLISECWKHGKMKQLLKVVKVKL